MRTLCGGDLLKSVRDLARHRRGRPVAGVRVTEVADIELRAVREATKLSQAEFAELVGVPVKTLQNWEQRRTRPPAGEARALLRALAKDPHGVTRALHA
jgi:putative transcriptional regulator